MAMATEGHFRSPLAIPNNYFSLPPETASYVRPRSHRSTPTNVNAASNARTDVTQTTSLLPRTNWSSRSTVKRTMPSTDISSSARSQQIDHEQQQQQQMRRKMSMTKKEEQENLVYHHMVQQVPYVNVLALSKVDQSRISTARQRVCAGGFYHGQLSAADACRILSPYPFGTFLIRDSSERDRYPFTITVRIDSLSTVATSIRIVYKSGHFRFDGLPEAASLLPSFPCVLELIRHHVYQRQDDTVCSNQRSGNITFIDCSSSSTNETSILPVVLRNPLPVSRSPSTLKHLCRRRINGLLDGRCASRLYLLPSLKQYIADYPSDL